MPPRFTRLVFVVTGAFFAPFFLWPVAQILQGGFIDADGRLTFAYLGAILSDPTYLTGLRNAFLLASAATLLAILIALPLAVVGDRYRFPGKVLLGALVLVPLILPPFVGAIGIKQIFGQYGALNVLLQHLHLLAPATSSGASPRSKRCRSIPSSTSTPSRRSRTSIPRSTRPLKISAAPRCGAFSGSRCR